MNKKPNESGLTTETQSTRELPNEEVSETRQTLTLYFSPVPLTPRSHQPLLFDGKIVGYIRVTRSNLTPEQALDKADPFYKETVLNTVESVLGSAILVSQTPTSSLSPNEPFSSGLSDSEIEELANQEKIVPEYESPFQHIKRVMRENNQD